MFTIFGKHYKFSLPYNIRVNDKFEIYFVFDEMSTFVPPLYRMCHLKLPASWSRQKEYKDISDGCISYIGNNNEVSLKLKSCLSNKIWIVFTLYFESLDV